MSGAPRVPGGLIVPAIRLPDDYGRIDVFARLLTEAGVAGFIVYGGDEELTPPFLRRLREIHGGVTEGREADRPPVLHLHVEAADEAEPG